MKILSRAEIVDRFRIAEPMWKSWSAMNYNNEDVAKIKDIIFGFVPVIYGYVIRDISKMDGIKITYSDDSFISCRFSGTESVIRIIVDADNEEKTNR